MVYRLALLPAAVMLFAACSAVLDKTTTQCQSDADCTRFPMTTCDLKAQVCVARPADAAVVDATVIPDVTNSCRGPGGCYACLPSSEEQVKPPAARPANAAAIVPHRRPCAATDIVRVARLGRAPRAVVLRRRDRAFCYGVTEKSKLAKSVPPRLSCKTNQT